LDVAGPFHWKSHGRRIKFVPYDGPYNSTQPQWPDRRDCMDRAPWFSFGLASTLSISPTSHPHISASSLPCAPKRGRKWDPWLLIYFFCLWSESVRLWFQSLRCSYICCCRWLLGLLEGSSYALKMYRNSTREVKLAFTINTDFSNISVRDKDKKWTRLRESAWSTDVSQEWP
jgi:hypothetical protein